MCRKYPPNSEHALNNSMRLATRVYGIGITVCTILHPRFFVALCIYMLIRMSPFTVWTICFLHEVCTCVHMKFARVQIETIYFPACAYLLSMTVYFIQ